MSYKVWVSIEDVGAEDDDAPYEDIGLPDPLGVFVGLDEAEEFVRTLLTLYNPDALETSDHRR